MPFSLFPRGAALAATALFAMGLTFSSAAMAQSGSDAAAPAYRFRVLINPESAKTSETTPLAVTLTTTTPPPDGMLGRSYGPYDLMSLLYITGGSGSVNPADVSWSISSGALPSGLILSPDGMLSGVPSSEEAANFTLLASYKGKSSEQTYTIQVGAAVLHVTQISTGKDSTCAVTVGGAVMCWGQNNYGQLGDGTTTDSPVPVQVVGLTSGVASVSSGWNHNCAVTTVGSVKCWGSNNSSQLGNNSITSSPVPVQVVGLTSGVASVSAGAYHTCALTTGGAALCWGSNNEGQLGDNLPESRHQVPVQVVGLNSGVASISAGAYHTCALTTGGAALCWGYSQYGQLGDGTTTSSPVPVQVVGLPPSVVSISSGSSHTCVLTTGGAALCWGGNGFGQLGNGTTTDSYVPVQVTGLASGVTFISAGVSSTCAVTTGGAAGCWGDSRYGQLGSYTAKNSPVPVQVTGFASGVTSVSGGYSRNCAVAAGGVAMCWGQNPNGQLGDGTTVNRSVPTNVLPG